MSKRREREKAQELRAAANLRIRRDYSLVSRWSFEFMEPHTAIDQFALLKMFNAFYYGHLPKFDFEEEIRLRGIKSDDVRIRLRGIDSDDARRPSEILNIQSIEKLDLPLMSKEELLNIFRPENWKEMQKTIGDSEIYLVTSKMDKYYLISTDAKPIFKDRLDQIHHGATLATLDE